MNRLMVQHMSIIIDPSLKGSLRFDSLYPGLLFITSVVAYRENNREANKASKEGLLLMLSQWKIQEWVDGSAHEYYHRPFIEGFAQM